MCPFGMLLVFERLANAAKICDTMKVMVDVREGLWGCSWVEGMMSVDGMSLGWLLV